MERMGSKIIEMVKLNKNFPDRTILKDFTYAFQRGERIGIIGKNGTGKSTFLNILTKTMEPDSGKVIIGDTIKIGYYTQSGINPKPGQKVIDIIKEYGEYIPLTKGKIISASQLLERFLFDAKKQYDFVEKLSGGELKRLYLCTVLIQNPNFLILDEPTNDLDIFVMSVLEDYLRHFEGCLIVVSHDRYFMDKMVDHIFVFEGQGAIKDIVGNYTEYRKEIAAQKKSDKEGGAKAEVKTESKAQQLSPAVEKVAPAKRKLSFKEKIEFETIEKELEGLEAEKEIYTNKLSDTSLSNDELMKAGQKLGEIVEAIDSKTERWIELSEFA
jgi:ATP-binding cassette subfamily F protein uup